MESGPRHGGAAWLITRRWGSVDGWDRNPNSPLVPLGLAFGGLAEPIPHPLRHRQFGAICGFLELGTLRV